MSANKQFRFSLSISRDDYLAYYQGVAEQVIVRDDRGVKVQFPASALRPYVTHQGIRGRFILTIDENNRLQKLERIA